MVVVAFFMVVVAPVTWLRHPWACGLMTWRPLTPRMHLAPAAHICSPGNWLACFHPSGELSFVELVVLMDVEVARVLAR
jgi:hypothetical protein